MAGFFAKFAKVFVDLGDYKLGLMKESQDLGIPMIRSLMLEFDNTDLHIDDQFMLGPDIMMAPILIKGTDSREIYFPAGHWEHYFTGDKYNSVGKGMFRNLNCPIGFPCVFKKLKDSHVSSILSGFLSN